MKDLVHLPNNSILRETRSSTTKMIKRLYVNLSDPAAGVMTLTKMSFWFPSRVQHYFSCFPHTYAVSFLSLFSQFKKLTQEKSLQSCQLFSFCSTDVLMHVDLKMLSFFFHRKYHSIILDCQTALSGWPP